MVHAPKHLMRLRNRFSALLYMEDQFFAVGSGSFQVVPENVNVLGQ
jgi:hypothetical protein